MSSSANNSRAGRKLLTSHRIRRCALLLTRDKGLDGWTMEDLAEAAAVSRRTLFNYFPGKIDAIIGPGPELPPERLSVFREGGPSGRLLDDLGDLAKSFLEDKDFDRDTVAVRRHVFACTPRLMMTAHERFEAMTGELVELILEREGPDFGATRARLVVRILVALFDASLVTMLAEADERPLIDIYDESLRHARDLLA